MTEPRSAVRAHRVELPEHIRVLDTLADPDYTWACAVTAQSQDERTAQEWARAVFEGAPRPVQWFLVTGWVGFLRLRPGPRRSPSLIFGWKILSATPTTATLTINAAAFSTHLVVDVQQSRVVHATFLRYERRRARFLWAMTEPIHRLTIRYLLGHAAQLPPKTD